MTSYAKAVCFSVGILFVLYCVCRGVHSRSDTEEKEYDVRSEVTEFRTSNQDEVQRILERKRCGKNSRLDCDFHGSRDAYPAGL